MVGSGEDAPIKVGSCLPLRNIPVGSVIHCIELRPGKGAQMARSAGASVQLVAREGRHATLRLRSGEMRKVLSECRATLGEVSNGEHSLRQLGKAGAKRWRGVRPTVRGVVMNPVDHPHGERDGALAAGQGPLRGALAARIHGAVVCAPAMCARVRLRPRRVGRPCSRELVAA